MEHNHICCLQYQTKMLCGRAQLFLTNPRSTISQHIRLVPQILIFVFIHIRHFVPSQFKQCISRMFVKITMAVLMGAFFNKFTGMEVKYKIAIYNKILN